MAQICRLLDAIASVPEEILGEMAQLTKENSIEGCKAGAPNSPLFHAVPRSSQQMALPPGKNA